MSKRLRATLGILVILILGGTIWLDWRPAEPVYRGKRLSTWLEQATDPGPMSKADTNYVAAIRQFGPDIVPNLLKMVKAQDSLFDRFWLTFANNNHWPFLKIRTASDYHGMACFGFYSLGPLGKSAVPELVKMLGTTNWDVHALAADCREISALTRRRPFQSCCVRSIVRSG